MTAVAVAMMRIARGVVLVHEEQDHQRADQRDVGDDVENDPSTRLALLLLRLHEQVHHRDQDDAAAHDQCVVLNEAALHAAQHHRAALGARRPRR